MKTVFTLSSLLLASALLLTGHGIQITLLPLKAAQIGLSDTIIGFTGSAYFLGFVIGCFTVPQMIGRVGHIRAFAVLTSIMVSALLSMQLVEAWPLWALARAAIGFMMCGLYTIIESWLNDQATESTRGRVLASYTLITLLSMALGQFLLAQLSIQSATPFILAAMLVSFAIVPVGLTRQLAPAPMVPTRVSFGLLYKRSKVAFAGALMAGLVTGSFWALGAVFAKRTMGSLEDVSLFVAAAIMGGALLQYPVGLLSDYFGRSRVLVALSILCAITSLVVSMGDTRTSLLVSIFLFGAVSMPIYALSLATVIDQAEAGEFLLVGTSVLLLNATGAAIGPIVLGQLMDWADARALWWGLSVISVMCGSYIYLHRNDVGHTRPQDQTPFTVAAPEMAPTSFDMDPRGPEHSDTVIDPAPERPAFDEAPADDSDSDSVVR